MRTGLFIIFLVFIMLMPAAIFAQSLDTIYVDSVQVESSAINPVVFSVPVHLHASETIIGGSLGHYYDSDDISIDSVSLAGGVASSLNAFPIADTANNLAVIGFVHFFGSPIAPGDGLLANLWFTLRANAPDQVINIDSGFFAPFGDYVLSDATGHSLYPAFVPGTITVGASTTPQLVIDLSYMEFNAFYGGPNPDPQDFSITNGGTGDLNWTASESAIWLSLSQYSGTAPTTVTVFIDLAGLSAGNHVEDITVTAPGASGSPQTIEVTLNIAETAPEILLGPTYFYFEAIQGEKIYLYDTLAITEAGGGAMNWTADNSADWLNLDPVAGTSPAIVQLEVITDGLSSGLYRDTIIVSAPGATNTPQAAPVDLLVLCQGMCGDANGDSLVDISDAMWLSNYIFYSGAAPQYQDCADYNNDEIINVNDVVYLLNYIFAGSNAPLCLENCCPPLDPSEAVYEVSYDTIFVGSVQVYSDPVNPITVGVPVYIHAADTISAGSLGHHYSSGDAAIDSVILEGVAGNMLAYNVFDPDSQLAVIGFWNPTSYNWISPGDSLLATMWFTLAANAPEQVITIDSGFFAPDGFYVLSGSDGLPRGPNFVAGQITVFPTPEIYSVYPNQNAVNVSPSTEISATFTVPMDSSAFNIAFHGISLYGSISGWHSFNFKYHDPTLTATMIPDDSFLPGELVTVCIKKNAQSTEGVNLQYDYYWQFYVGSQGGSGSFDLDTSYNISNWITDITAADFDGDGYIDIAVADSSSDSLFVSLNSSGQMSAFLPVPGIANPVSVTAVDMYGRHDLYAINAGIGPLGQYLNNGSGNFAYEDGYSLLSGGLKVVYYPVKLYENMIFGIADHYNDKIGIYWLQCMDSCQIASSEEFDVGNGPRRLAFADFDSDGMLDIAVANSYTDSMTILWGEDYGTARTDYNVGAWQADLVSGDFNQDGLADIVTANTYTTGIRILINNGDKTFSVDSFNYFVGHPSSICAADFNNDGALDLAIGYSDSGFVTLFENPGDGDFSNPTHIRTNCASYALSAADFNNDGAVDIAAAGYYYYRGSSNFSIVFNKLQDSDSDSIPDNLDNCPYTFNPLQEDSDYDGIGDSCDGDYPIYDIDTLLSADLYYVQTADVDRDNYTDLVYSASVDTGLFIAYGNAAGTLDLPIKLLHISEAAMAIDYVNADTLLDILAVNAADIHVLINNGNRNFSHFVIPLPKQGERQELNSIATGYFNDDEYVDMVYAPDKIRFGNGDGTFSPEGTICCDFVAAQVCDFNNDGYDDLLTNDIDRVEILLQTAPGVFSSAHSIYHSSITFEVPPVSVVADFNADCNMDFAFTVPYLVGSVDPYTDIYAVYTDGSGGVQSMPSMTTPGYIFDMVSADVNRDNIPDLVAANGTMQHLEIYYGTEEGDFSTPQIVPLDDVAGSDLTYVLATLDLNRDGNYDFVAGGPDGENLAVAVDDQQGSTESLDEMVVTGYNNIDIKVINPDGFVISKQVRTVAGSDFQINDVDQDGSLDQETYDYNLQYGEYAIILTPDPTSPPDGLFDVGVKVNGTVKAIVFDGYSSDDLIINRSRGCPEDPVIFYYTVEPVPSINPGNGMTAPPMPVFDWSGMVGKIFPEGSYHFQLDRYYDFRDPIFDVAGLVEPSFMTPTPLGADSVFYWRFQSYSGGGWTEFSRTFAVYVAGYKCGDANGDDKVNVSDAVSIINYVFVGGSAPDPLAAGDPNCDGKCNVSDAVWIINYVFVGGNVPCDTNGDEIPDC